MAGSSSKYRNKRTEKDNICFQSKKEASRYEELKLLQQAGVISELRLQPVFPLVVNGTLIARYIADFQYVDTATHEEITEDVKSPATRTQVYRLKKKLVKALYGIEIQEV